MTANSISTTSGGEGTTTSTNPPTILGTTSTIIGATSSSTRLGDAMTRIYYEFGRRVVCRSGCMKVATKMIITNAGQTNLL